MDFRDSAPESRVSFGTRGAASIEAPNALGLQRQVALRFTRRRRDIGQIDLRAPPQYALHPEDQGRGPHLDEENEPSQCKPSSLRVPKNDLALSPPLLPIAERLSSEKLYRTKPTDSDWLELPVIRRDYRSAYPFGQGCCVTIGQRYLVSVLRELRLQKGRAPDKCIVHLFADNQAGRSKVLHCLAGHGLPTIPGEYILHL